MKRYRWSHAKMGFDIKTLIQRIKEKPFEEVSESGFITDKIRQDYFEARYIERFKYTDKIKDPLGNEHIFERIAFNTCEFRMSKNFPEFELVDPPRKTQSFVSSLSAITDFSFGLRSLSVNVLDWVSAIQKNTDLVVTVSSMQIGSLELTPGTTAKIVLKSNNNDVRDVSSQLYSDKQYQIEKIQLHIRDEYQGTVILENSGSAKVDVIHNEDFAGILRASLSQVVEL